jgi:hypothetical protein
MVLSVFRVFLQVLQMHFSSISSTFRQMLQMVHMNVSNIDRVLHLPHCLMLPRLGVSSFSRSLLGIHRLLPLLSIPVTFWRRGPHVGARNGAEK